MGTGPEKLFFWFLRRERADERKLGLGHLGVFNEQVRLVVEGEAAGHLARGGVDIGERAALDVSLAEVHERAVELRRRPAENGDVRPLRAAENEVRRHAEVVADAADEGETRLARALFVVRKKGLTDAQLGGELALVETLFVPQLREDLAE